MGNFFNKLQLQNEDLVMMGLIFIILINDTLIKADNTIIRVDTNKQMRVCIYSIMLYFTLHVSTRMSHLQVFLYMEKLISTEILC
jgi:small-conductance mechanosensitive channel